MRRFPSLIKYIMVILLMSSIVLLAVSLDVSFDKEYYEPGDTVRITIRGPKFSIVGIEVRDPDDELLTVYELTIGEEGYVVYDIALPDDAKLGVYDVYVAIPGSFVKTAFKVVKRSETRIIIYAPPFVAAGVENVFLGFLYPGIERSIDVYIFKGVKWEFLGFVKCNSTGWFRFVWVPDKPGVYKLKFVFEGDEYFKPSEFILSVKVLSEEEKESLPPVPTCFVIPPKIDVGSSAVISCKDCQGFYVYGPVGEYELEGSRHELFFNNASIWLFYPYRNGLKGTACMLKVVQPVSLNLVSPYEEYGLNTKVILLAKITPVVSGFPIEFYLVREGEDAFLGSSYTDGYGVAVFTWSPPKLGVYRFKTIYRGSELFTGAESNIVEVRVVEDVYNVTLVAVDSQGRRVYDAVIVVDGVEYRAPMGYLTLLLKKGMHEVVVYKGDIVIYQGQIYIEKEGEYLLTTKLYIVRVSVYDFFGAPAPGVIVVLKKGDEVLKAVLTDEYGVAVFGGMPEGFYEVVAGGVVKSIEVHGDTGVTVKLPPPTWLIALSVIFGLSIIYAVYRFVMGQKEKEE